jgi:mRNA interferase MazF
MQRDPFNASRIHTVMVTVVASDVRLAHAPGNVLLERRQSRLPRDAVIHVSQLLTIDKALLTERVSLLRTEIMARVEAGLKLVLGLCSRGVQGARRRESRLTMAPPPGRPNPRPEADRQGFVQGCCTHPSSGEPRRVSAVR